ncbi:MAG TPA: hypothetical protein VF468_16355 [Actinomycetota bacterium]|nr:hypothetical protein [Actinomycetota bacterium]
MAGPGGGAHRFRWSTWAGVRGVAVGPGAIWVTTGSQVVQVDPSRLPRPDR